MTDGALSKILERVTANRLISFLGEQFEFQKKKKKSTRDATPDNYRK
jgi:hypothetical protein